MRIDVYDFDGTIYDGDSTADFVLFAFRRHPALLAELPGIIGHAFLLLIRKIDLTAFKSSLFGAMAKHFSLTEESEAFWDSPKTRSRLGSWFGNTPRDLPVVIASASPEFELVHAAEILQVFRLVGTRCDMKTGKLIGVNCKRGEKIRRIREEIGEFEVRAMYTDDAKADAPLLALAEEKYILTHGRIQKQE